MCMFSISEENTHPPGLIWKFGRPYLSETVFEENR